MTSDLSLLPLQFSALPPVRVVFSITMEGSARKVITVRSALMVRNRLEVPMELRLDSPSAPDSKTQIGVCVWVGGGGGGCCPLRYVVCANSATDVLVCDVWIILTWRCVCASAEPVVLPPILPGQATPIPLHLMSWRLQARPKGLGLFFCKVPIHWTSVERTGEVSSSKRECQSANFEDQLKHNFRWASGLR